MARYSVFKTILLHLHKECMVLSEGGVLKQIDAFRASAGACEVQILLLNEMYMLCGVIGAHSVDS